MSLRHWMSNKNSVMEEIPSDDRANPGHMYSTPRIISSIDWCKMHKGCRERIKQNIKQKHIWPDSQCVHTGLAAKAL